MIIKIILILILCGLSFLGGIYLDNESLGWEQITSVTLILTLIVIIIYTIETGRLRRETARQAELSLRPLIIPRWSDGRPQRYYFINIGKGPALKIKMDDIPLVEEAGIIYSFDEIDILSPLEKKVATIRIGDTICDDFKSAAIMPRSGTRSLDFVIEYTDINNKKYQTKGKLGGGGVRIKSTQ